MTHQLLAQAVVVGERAIVHEAGVLAGREGVRPRDGDGGLGGHARVADGVRAFPRRQLEARGDPVGVADALEDFDSLPLAQHRRLGHVVDQPLARRAAVALGLEDGVILDLLYSDACIDGLREPLGDVPPRDCAPVADRADFGDAWYLAAIDREPRAVRPAIAQLGEHRRSQPPQLRLELGVLEEQTDNSTHARP